MSQRISPKLTEETIPGSRIMCAKLCQSSYEVDIVNARGFSSASLTTDNGDSNYPGLLQAPSKKKKKKDYCRRSRQQNSEALNAAPEFQICGRKWAVTRLSAVTYVQAQVISRPRLMRRLIAITSSPSCSFANICFNLNGSLVM